MSIGEARTNSMRVSWRKLGGIIALGYLGRSMGSWSGTREVGGQIEDTFFKKLRKIVSLQIAEMLSPSFCDLRQNKLGERGETFSSKPAIP